MKDITFKNIVQKLKAAIRAVFSGDATPQEFIEVFVGILTIIGFCFLVYFIIEKIIS